MYACNCTSFLFQSLSRTVPGIGVYFSSLHHLKSTFGSQDPHPLESMAIGACARSISGLTMLPFTVVKTRFEVFALWRCIFVQWLWLNLCISLYLLPFILLLLYYRVVSFNTKVLFKLSLPSTNLKVWKGYSVVSQQLFFETHLSLASI